jgi:ribosomal protein L40E
VFVIPIKWTIEELGVRHFEHEKAMVRALELSPYLADFISFSAAYQFLITMFSAGTAHDAFLYLVVFMLLIFPPALLMTTLYVRFSLPKNARALRNSFEQKGYGLTRKNLHLVEPSSGETATGTLEAKSIELLAASSDKTRFCMNCGLRIPSTADFCPDCGTNQK